MPALLKFLGMGVAAVCAAYLLFFAVMTLYRVSLASMLSAKTMPFISSGKGPRILVIGDSTGVGTGSATPSLSIAGRLSAFLGGAAITNLAVNGEKIAEVREQLTALPAQASFDLILIQAGGNDILRFIPLGQLRRDTALLLQEAKRYGRYVVFMSTGDVGTAPLFLPPLNAVYDRRTRAARAIFMDAAQHADVIYVDLFKEPQDEPFSKDPKRFYAADGLHPSGDGYGLWFEELKTKLPPL